MNPSEQTANDWITHRGFGGLDWASQTHAIIIVDARGRVVEDFEIEHSARGWQKFRERLQPYGSIPFAIETCHGAAVEQLLEAGMIVYPLNPKSAQAYRDRKAPSGVKDDRLDAWSFADACRVDGQGWKALRPEDPLLKELRLLCRDEVTFIEQRTALINQLRQALAEYYPTALEAFNDWSTPASWSFLQRFPTPQGLQQAGKRRSRKLPARQPPVARGQRAAPVGALCPGHRFLRQRAHGQSQEPVSPQFGVHPRDGRKTARYLPPTHRGAFQASSRSRPVWFFTGCRSQVGVSAAFRDRRRPESLRG